MERNRTNRGRDDADEDRGRGRGSSSGFKYRSRDPEEAKRRAAGGMVDPFLKDELKLFKAHDGDNDVRVLPPTWDGAKHYGLEVFIHYDVGQGAYLCLQKMKGKPCPVCEERERANKAGDEEYAKQCAPSSRVISYIVDRKKPKEGIQVWNVGYRQDQDVLRLGIDKKTGEVLEVDHPDKGYDLSFTRIGTGPKTRYSAFSFARRSSPLDDDEAMEFAVEHPLAAQLQFYSYDHIKEAFEGGVTKSKKEDDEDPPKRRASKDDEDAPKRRSSRDDDDEPPKRKPKAADVDLTWAEVHELTFRKLEALIDDHKLDIDPSATRDDEELADQVCEALDIDKPAKKRPRDDDDEPPKRRASRDDDEDPPKRRASKDDEDDAPARRPSKKDDDEEDNPRAKLRKLREE